jgi:hypothetical protein
MIECAMNAAVNGTLDTGPLVDIKMTASTIVAEIKSQQEEMIRKAVDLAIEETKCACNMCGGHDDPYLDWDVIDRDAIVKKVMVE